MSETKLQPASCCPAASGLMRYPAVRRPRRSALRPLAWGHWRPSPARSGATASTPSSGPTAPQRRRRCRSPSLRHRRPTTTFSNSTSPPKTLSLSRASVRSPTAAWWQGDIFLNGVPYLQVISDITVPTQSIGIHFEPGIWVIVPATTNPAEGVTLVRMASIPHGTTIDAQGTFTTIAGKPTIPAVDITPTLNAPPQTKIKFPSQTATNNNSARIPQDLTPFIAAGTITQAILDDPNTILRNHIAPQTITSTTIISISTSPTAPLFGGGTDNIAFLLGNPTALTNPVPPGPNAQATLIKQHSGSKR